MRKGQTLPPKQRIRVELDLPKGFLDQFGPLPTSRAAGAAFTAAGIYTIVRLISQFGREVIQGVKNLTADIFSQVSIPTINLFLAIFGIDLGVTKRPGKLPSHTAEQTLKELGTFDPLAFGAALMGGGMVLAGLNPGEVLKGIGSIIDALIPL